MLKDYCGKSKIFKVILINVREKSFLSEHYHQKQPPPKFLVPVVWRFDLMSRLSSFLFCLAGCSLKSLTNTEWLRPHLHEWYLVTIRYWMKPPTAPPWWKG
ncbi:hypothetical protein AVEN_157189-1 [Araneus ventricosus]|uniref:Uncharacterized protein n=1 Tax=Araneus ventricosus TaxID=182803 RepID=A0A4Y2VFH6_ARAVE|nr:hypothetical protein AVEN_157189-1 [Araneus ventricosus]